MLKEYGGEPSGRGARWKFNPAARRRAGAALLLSLGLAGCEGIFDVDLPGQLVAADLNDPALAETLVLGVQGDFECGFRGYLTRDVIWSGVYTYVSGTLNWMRAEQRSKGTEEGGKGDCEDNREPVWLPMHIVRGQAQTAVSLIEGFPEGSVQSPEFLISRAYLFEGYATQLLSEHYCGIVFDGDGIVREREVGFQTAAALFTKAIDLASSITSGLRAQQARVVVNTARVGRARAKLNLGDGPGAVADAELVDQGFVANLTYDASGPQRRHWHRPADLTGTFSVRPHYRELKVDGVPDPRVPTQYAGPSAFAGVDRWVQLKYPNAGSSIPFATWREAQLVIAEVEGGQRAVQIINALRSTHGLPTFSSTDPAEIRAQVLDERRRELFLQGTQVGDDIRTGEWVNWPRGTTSNGLPIDATASCMPIPNGEFF